jgi:hypothetical protein
MGQICELEAEEEEEEKGEYSSRRWNFCCSRWE